MKYRKKPVIIEALLWDGKNLREIINFTGLHQSARKFSLQESDNWEIYENLVEREGLKIFTLEGPMMASVGDYIIKGIKGEFYPCKPDIFAASYSPASDPTPSSTEGLRNDLGELVKQYDETIQKYTDFSNTAYHNMNPKAADMWNHKRDGIVKAKRDIQKLLDKHSS